FARDVEQILDRERDAGEYRQRLPSGAPSIHFIGLGSGGVARHADESAGAFALRIPDTRQRFIDQRTGTYAATDQSPRQLAEGGHASVCQRILAGNTSSHAP